MESNDRLMNVGGSTLGEPPCHVKAFILPFIFR